MSVAAALRAMIGAGTPAILVTVERARGSTPREAGAAMAVTPTRTAGTIGGGALEMEAILEARRMLGEGADTSRLAIPLGPAIGQCCGGHVTLRLERAGAATLARLDAAESEGRRHDPAVYVFGAGHTGQAFARALAPLPVRLMVVDPRTERLADLPDDIERIATPLPETAIDRAEPGAAFVVMTHDHALDFLLTARALERGDAAYVGMIGSRTKRQKFERHLALSGSSADAARLVLPIGGALVRDKRPTVIAALTAAEILRTFAALENGCTDFAPAQMRCNMGPADEGNASGDTMERHAATSRA